MVVNAAASALFVGVGPSVGKTLGPVLSVVGRYALQFPCGAGGDV